MRRLRLAGPLLLAACHVPPAPVEPAAEPPASEPEAVEGLAPASSLSAASGASKRNVTVSPAPPRTASRRLPVSNDATISCSSPGSRKKDVCPMRVPPTSTAQPSHRTSTRRYRSALSSARSAVRVAVLSSP